MCRLPGPCRTVLDFVRDVGLGRGPFCFLKVVITVGPCCDCGWL